MTQGPTRPHSLINRLLIAQIAPLAVVAVVLVVTGAWTAHRVVERTSDRLLAGATEIIRQSVSVDDGRVTVDVAPWSLALLDSPERDAVFYSVRHGDRLVTGYDELPLLPDVTSEAPTFGNLDVRGLPVRMAQQSIHIPDVPDAVVVSVAQTLDSRQASIRDLTSGLVVLPGLLAILAALLVWPATRWGLYSLRRLTRELASRSATTATAFAPAPVQMAPKELTSVLTAFNALLASLERSTSGIQRFSADASHQLRTPLSIVSANLDLLSRSRRPWTRAEQRLLGDSRDAIAAMTRLVGQLLAAARADGARPVSQGDLRRALVDAIQHHQQAMAMEAHIRFRAPACPVIVQGDELLMFEQIANLLDNAGIHGAPSVHVWLSTNGNQARVTIWDHGEGVAPDDLPRLTERFYRAAQGKASGSGLGLSIVQAMAARQGGRLTIRNRTRRPGFVATLEFDRFVSSQHLEAEPGQSL